MQTFDA